MFEFLLRIIDVALLVLVPPIIDVELLVPSIIDVVLLVVLVSPIIDVALLVVPSIIAPKPLIMVLFTKSMMHEWQLSGLGTNAWMQASAASASVVHWFRISPSRCPVELVEL